MSKKVLQQILAILVIIVGVYMFAKHPWMTPPSVSGIGFLLTGLALWIPNCPICAKICKK